MLTMADVTANLQAATTASTPYALPTNLPLLSAFLSFALAQFLKIFTSWCVRLSHFHHRVSFPLCLAHLSSVQSLFPSSVRSKHCDEKSARLSFFFLGSSIILPFWTLLLQIFCVFVFSLFILLVIISIGKITLLGCLLRMLFSPCKSNPHFYVFVLLV